MSSDQNQYRPRSPDLSALGSKQNSQQPQPPPRLSRLPSYQIQEPSLPQGYSFSPRGSYDASPFFSPVTQQPPPSYFNFPSAGSPQSIAAVLPKHYSQPSATYNPPQLAQSPQKLINHDYPDTPRHGLSSVSSDSFPQHYPNLHPQSYDEMARLRQRKAVNYNENQGGPNEFDEHLPPMPVPNNQASLPFDGQHHFEPIPEFAPLPPQQQSQLASGSTSLPKVDVKTKFPVARIKRIMQADEDVGKVAQATPSAVSKALELFMIALVTKGAAEAKSQNSKRVTATHLKTALLKDSQFDFLNEVCESAPDEGAKKRAKSDAKDSDSEDDGDVKKKSKGRRKKTGSDADSE